MRNTFNIRNKTDFSIVLLCANEYYGRAKFGVKSFFEIGEGNLLDLQIKILRKVFGNKEIFVVCGAEAENYAKHRLDSFRILENQRFQEQGEGPQIKAAINASNGENLLVINGDLVFSSDSVKNLNLLTSFVVSGTGVGLDSYIHGEYDCEAISFAPSNRKFAEITYFKDIPKLYKIVSDPENSKILTHEIINILADETEFKVEERKEISKINTKKDLEKIESTYNE